MTAGKRTIHVPAALIAQARGKAPTASQTAASKAKRARPVGRRAEIAENAAKGVLPPVPDFSAATHARFRKRLAELVALAEAGNVKALRAVAINPISTSPMAMARFRDLAVIAIEARKNAS